MTDGVGVQLIAAYLGVSRARVQQIIAANDIQPVGQMWKQLMYDPQEVIRHAGAHDRRPAGKVPRIGLTLTPSDRMP